jgi:hypothetical protein
MVSDSSRSGAGSCSSTSASRAAASAGPRSTRSWTIFATRTAADAFYTSCANGPGSPCGFYLPYGFAYTGR